MSRARRQSKRASYLPLAYQERQARSCLIGHQASLRPAPNEVIAVDGSGADGSVKVARAAALRTTVDDVKGRSPLCALHADTCLPDVHATVQTGLASPSVALASFTSVRSGARKMQWVTIPHDSIKICDAPRRFPPWLSACHGLRVLFGDHALLLRLNDFPRVGGLLWDRGNEGGRPRARDERCLSVDAAAGYAGLTVPMNAPPDVIGSTAIPAAERRMQRCVVAGQSYIRRDLQFSGEATLSIRDGERPASGARSLRALVAPGLHKGNSRPAVVQVSGRG